MILEPGFQIGCQIFPIAFDRELTVFQNFKSVVTIDVAEEWTSPGKIDIAKKSLLWQNIYDYHRR